MKSTVAKIGASFLMLIIALFFFACAEKQADLTAMVTQFFACVFFTVAIFPLIRAIYRS